MFLTIQNPHGEVFSLALTDLQVWGLELRATRYHQAKPEGEDARDEPSTLALGITFVAGGAKVFQSIAGIDLLCRNGDVGTIASEGLRGGTPELNKEGLRDRLGMLHNGAEGPASRVDELIAKASKLADIHANIVRVLWSTPSNIDQAAAALLKGEFEGWKYGITRTRFEAVFTAGMSAAEGMGEPPGLGLGGRPPPPVAEKGSSRRKPPVLSEQIAPSAEAQAKADAKDAGGASDQPG